MRTSARLLLVAAVAAVTLAPASSANAVYCGTLHPVCQAICRVGEVVDAQCLA